MQFSNRFCDDLQKHKERRAAYLRHLAHCGFGLDDPEYRWFVGEVFHDRPVTILKNEGELVEFSLTNSYALNCVAIELQRQNRKGEINPQHFEMRVTLRGVVDRSLSRLGELERPCYHQAELSKIGGQRCIEVEVRDDENLDRDPVLVFVRYQIAEISDIARIVRTYLGSAIDVNALLSPVWRAPDEELKALQHHL